MKSFVIIGGSENAFVRDSQFYWGSGYPGVYVKCESAFNIVILMFRNRYLGTK